VARKTEPHPAGDHAWLRENRVRTQSLYLGTAESIRQRLQQTRTPLEVHHRQFGFVAAIYQTAVEVSLVDLLKKHLPGERYGLPRWLYFLVPIMNRLHSATSKERMGRRAKTTVLPDLLAFAPHRLTSNTFWYATEDVISEKALRQQRAEQPALQDELFTGIDDAVFRRIEEELFAHLKEQFHLSGAALLYDTTNFFTYREEPVRSQCARTG
jgi:hypothetical protein